jgi:hypothetical protein
MADMQSLLPEDRVVYMCFKDDGPLYHDDMPMVFGDPADARDALADPEDASEIVAELKLETVVKRFEGAGVDHVYYQPPGVTPAQRVPLLALGT